MLPFARQTRTGTLQIIDDEFSVQPPRVISICEEFQRRGLQPRLVFDSRANDLLNDRMVEALSPYAFQFLVGAECGYDEGLKKTGKGTTCAALEKAAATLQRHGLAGKADFSFILGLPWETKAEVLQTIRFACGLYARFGIRVLMQWFCQIPGSHLWQESRKLQTVHEAQYHDFGFFRNLYLFRTGVRLTPEEIDEITDVVSPIAQLSRIHTPEKAMVEYAHPESIRTNHPRTPREITDGAGLASLQEVAGRKTAMAPLENTAVNQLKFTE